MEAEEDIGGLVRETRDLVEEYIKPVEVTLTDPVDNTNAPAIYTKDGVEAVPAGLFDEYRAKPRFRHGTAKLTTLDSFIYHANRFKAPNSAVFASDDRRKPSLTSVLDYHPEGHASDPAFGKHRGLFEFPLSDEWQAWHAQNKVAMSQREFAEFIENRIVDVEHPTDLSFNDETLSSFIDKLGGVGKIASPTKLMEMSAGLSVHEQSVVKSATKLQSGESHLVLQSEHVDENGVEVDIPSMFVLAIPVFRSGAYYRVLARLRYRVAGGFVFWYELWRTDRVFDHAFDEACKKVNDETGLPVIYGSPE